MAVQSRHEAQAMWSGKCTHAYWTDSMDALSCHQEGTTCEEA